jgi:hypothetical protein
MRLNLPVTVTGIIVVEDGRNQGDGILDTKVKCGLFRNILVDSDVTER